MNALWDEGATPQEHIDALQEAINSGLAWNMEGSVGRAAHDAIENGACVLGTERRKDYYGNVVPSRFDVKPGSKGSIEYARKLRKQNRYVSIDVKQRKPKATVTN